jgi:hypothetical protein
MSDVTVPLGGFGSQGWGDSAWGEGNVSFVATGFVGTVTVIADVDVPVTGLEVTGFVGSVVIEAGSNVLVTGVAGTVRYCLVRWSKCGNSYTQGMISSFFLGID